MANSSGTLSGLHWLTGAAIGALAMYAFDPQRGRRRRAIARDKTLSLATHAGGFLRRAGRDLQGRMHGWQAQAQRWSRDEGIPDDLKLIERVRSRLGRVCSHPHAIQVGANQGRVTLGLTSSCCRTTGVPRCVLRRSSPGRRSRWPGCGAAAQLALRASASARSPSRAALSIIPLRR